MKKLFTLLFIVTLFTFASGCAENLDHQPEIIEPDNNTTILSVETETEEEEEEETSDPGSGVGGNN